MTVLKSKLSGYYFKDFGVWTSDPLAALAFTDEGTARDFVRCQPVVDVRVVELEVTTPELLRAA